MSDYEQCKKTVGFPDSKIKCNLPVGHTEMCGCTFDRISVDKGRNLTNKEIEEMQSDLAAPDKQDSDE